MIPPFEHYIGIDYSGAQTPKASLKGLRDYAADPLTVPQEIAAAKPSEILDAQGRR